MLPSGSANTRKKDFDIILSLLKYSIPQIIKTFLHLAFCIITFIFFGIGDSYTNIWNTLIFIITATIEGWILTCEYNGSIGMYNTQFIKIVFVYSIIMSVFTIITVSLLVNITIGQSDGDSIFHKFFMVVALFSTVTLPLIECFGKIFIGMRRERTNNY